MVTVIYWLMHISGNSRWVSWINVLELRFRDWVGMRLIVFKKKIIQYLMPYFFYPWEMINVHNAWRKFVFIILILQLCLISLLALYIQLYKNPLRAVRWFSRITHFEKYTVQNSYTFDKKNVTNYKKCYCITYSKAALILEKGSTFN